jgi:hypothetical protein
MSVVNCPTFKRRCAKSLSTVNRDGERAFVPPSRLVAPGGGVNFPDRSISFSTQIKGTVLLVNAFYVTYGSQTIIFAIFVSMNPPTPGSRALCWRTSGLRTLNSGWAVE